MSSKHYAIGADIGGSHISCAIIDLREMKIVENSLKSAEVNNHAEAAEILKVWAKVFQSQIELIDIEELAGVGLAMPGPFDYANGIALFEERKYQKLYGIDIRKELKDRLDLHDGIDVRFINDATAFAIGECWMGQARGYSRAVAITLGTGFGSAFLKEEIPIVEGDDVPPMGCIWHLPFLDGIADDSFSTRWFTNNYLDRSGKTAPGVREIAAQYDSDATARELFHEFGENLAEFLSPWLKRFDAEVLVIGGNIAGAWDLFGPAFSRGLKERQLKTIPLISELKEDAAFIGGARLLQESFWPQVKDLLPLMS